MHTVSAVTYAAPIVYDLDFGRFAVSKLHFKSVVHEII